MMLLQEAKDEIVRLLNTWMIVPEANISQQDPEAPITTIGTINKYLQSCQKGLSEAEFQELISSAIDEANTSLLRYETKEYWNGAIRRTVERPEFTELMRQLEGYLKPVEWSVSLQFAATEVLPPLAWSALFILAFSAVPVAAALGPKNNPDVGSTGGSPLEVNYTKAIIDVENAERQSRDMMVRMGIDYDAIPREGFIQPAVDIRTQIGQRKVETLANNLVWWQEGRFKPERQEKFIQRLLEDGDLIQPLNVILINSSNKELLHRITIKLTLAFYEKMLDIDVKNRNSLIVSLGHAIMAMPKITLIHDFSEEEIQGMVTVLFLYQPNHGDKNTVRERIIDLCGTPGMINHFCPILIYRVVTYNKSEKKIAQKHFSVLLAESTKLFPAGIPFPTDKSVSQFVKMYPKMFNAIIQLFDEANSLERFHLLKEIATFAKKLQVLKVGIEKENYGNDILYKKQMALCIEISLTMVYKYIDEELTPYENAISLSTKEWSKETYEAAGAHLLKILMIYRQFFGYPARAQEYSAIATNLAIKHGLAQKEVRQQQEDFFDILRLRHLEPLEAFSEPKARANPEIGSSALAVDYIQARVDVTAKPTVDINTQAGIKTVEILAHQLVHFFEASVSQEKQPFHEELIQRLLNEGDLMHPLNIILTHSRNKELLYKIAVNLTHQLYQNMLDRENVANRDSLIMSLGQAIMIMPQTSLKEHFSAEEIQGMTTVLFLYQPYVSDKIAVGERISDLCHIPGRMNDSCSILIYRVVAYDKTAKKKAQTYFSLLLKESMRLFPAEDRKAAIFSEDQDLSQFFEMYPKMLEAVIQLFDADKPLERFRLLKEISSFSKKMIAFKDGQCGPGANNAFMQQRCICIELSITMIFKRIDKDLTPYESLILWSEKSWDKDSYETGIKMLKMLMIYRRFFGYPARAKEYYDIAANLAIKHGLAQKEVRQQQEDFSDILRLRHLEPLEAFSEPKARTKLEIGSSALAVDYIQARGDATAKPTVDINTQAGIKTVEILAHQLTHFYLVRFEASISQEQQPPQEELIPRLLSEGDLMRPLNIILAHSSNKELLYKITVKLTHQLYQNMLNREGVANRDSLTKSLGQAIMAIPEIALMGDLSEDEIHTMIGVLFSYQPYHADKSAVRDRIQDLFFLSRTKNDFGSTLIYRAAIYNPAQKKIAQAHFLALGNESKELFSHVPPHELDAEEEQYVAKFLEMYPKFFQSVIKLFDADRSVERFNLVKEIYTLSKKLIHFSGEIAHSQVPDSIRLKLVVCYMELSLQMAFSRVNKDLVPYEKFMVSVAETWNARSYKVGIKLLEMLIIFRQYLGYPDKAQEYLHIIKELQIQHRAQPQDIASQKESISRIFVLGQLEAIEFPTEPEAETASLTERVEIPQETAPPVESGLMGGITLSTEFWLLLGGMGSGFFLSMGNFLTPPEELPARVQSVIETLVHTSLAVRRKDSHTGWWLTQIQYDVQNYNLLALFDLKEQENLLANALSTPEFTVSIVTADRQLIVSIKPKRWLPNWQGYCDHLQAISPSPLPSVIADKLGTLFKLTLNNVDFEESFTIANAKGDVKGVFVSAKLRIEPCLYDDLLNILQKYGIQASIKKGELSWLMPFDVLELGGDFKADFHEQLSHINADWDKIKNNFEKMAAIATIISFPGQKNIDFEMGLTGLKWHLQPNQHYVIEDTEITKESVVALVAYLLYRSYNIDAKIEASFIEHSFPQKEMVDNKEPTFLFRNVMMVFKLLKERYTLAHCELVFIDKKIQMRLSCPKMIYGLSAAQFFEVVQGELDKRDLPINLGKKPSLLVDLSVYEEGSVPGFEKDFASACQAVREKIELEYKREEEAQKILSSQQNLMKRLNNRLDQFVPGQNLQWAFLRDKEGAIGVVLKKLNYYTVGRINLSQSALIELIRKDLQKNGRVEESNIFSDESKRYPGVHRIGLMQWGSVEMSEEPIGQEIFATLEKLAHLYFPMGLMLDYRNGELVVCLELDDEKACLIQPYEYELGSSGLIACVQKSLQEVITVENKVIQEGNSLIVPLRLLNPHQLPNQKAVLKIKQDWYEAKSSRAEKEKLAERENSISDETVDKKRDEKNSQISAKKGGGKEKEKEKEEVKTSRIMPRSSRVKPTLFQPVRPIDEQIEERINKICKEIHLTLFELGRLSSSRVWLHKMLLQAKLYTQLSDWAEMSTYGYKHFSKGHIAKRPWLQAIHDPENLEILREFIIKKRHIVNHADFVSFLAERIVTSGSNMNPKNLIVQGLKQVGEEYSIDEEGGIRVKDSVVASEPIVGLIETLRGLYKGIENETQVGVPEEGLKFWIKEHIDLVNFLAVRAIELFKEMKEHAQKNLIPELRSMLNNTKISIRNPEVHRKLDPQPLPENKSQDLAAFIMQLTELPAELIKPRPASRNLYGFNASSSSSSGSSSNQESRDTRRDCSRSKTNFS